MFRYDPPTNVNQYESLILNSNGVFHHKFGVVSIASNGAAPMSITLSGSPAFWTNNTPINGFVGFVGATVTGVSKNGNAWPCALTGGIIPLQIGEWAGFTNAGVPSVSFTPF